MGTMTECVTLHKERGRGGEKSLHDAPTGIYNGGGSTFVSPLPKGAINQQLIFSARIPGLIYDGRMVAKVQQLAKARFALQESSSF